MKSKEEWCLSIMTMSRSSGKATVNLQGFKVWSTLDKSKAVPSFRCHGLAAAVRGYGGYGKSEKQVQLSDPDGRNEAVALLSCSSISRHVLGPCQRKVPPAVHPGETESTVHPTGTARQAFTIMADAWYI